MDWGPGRLRWERHTEFSTYLWDCPAPKEFGAPINSHPFGDQFNAPGSFISGVRIEVRHESREPDELLAGFDPVSVTMSDLPATRATVITDFRQDGDGLTRILVIDDQTDTLLIDEVAAADLIGDGAEGVAADIAARD